MKETTRNAISNHIGDASALVQRARESLAKARKLSRGERRYGIERIDRDLDVIMGRLGSQLDLLEPDGCPF